ncbi:MAG: DinB family protein [Desulfovibrionales bacterium]
MTSQTLLQQELKSLLQGGNAHMTLAQALDGFPLERINDKPPGLPYSFWHLLEHMRIVQWDILRFVIDPDHQSPPYPVGYWPDENATADSKTWDATVKSLLQDLDTVVELVENPPFAIVSSLPHAPGYSFLRELLLIADHLAYHTGELAILRRSMGFPSPHE